MLNKIIIVVAAIVCVFFLINTAGNLQLSTTAAIVIFFVALAISFIRGVEALYIIVFAMLFSPEILMTTATGRTGAGGIGAVYVRLEDILLVAVGCGWLLRTAYDRRHFGIARTGVNTSIGVYIAVCVVATMLGVIGGTVNLQSGFIENLKFFEYFFLFFMILAHVRSKKIITNMIIAMIVAFFLVIIYGYTQIELSGMSRVNAPFDSEPNTFGGYIVLLMCVIFGIVLADQRIRIRVPLTLLLLFAIPPFIFTLSRASYMAFIAGGLAFMIVSKQRIIVGAIIIGLVAVSMIGIHMLPEKVEKRIMNTFKAGTEYHYQIAGIDLDSSASARIKSYLSAIKTWEKAPFFGYGVTGSHFIDSQYFRLLAQTGLIGLSAFLFMILMLMKEIWKVHGQCKDDLLKGAALGFFCGIIAVLVHAVSANSFIIIRIAEPFWLLAGLILLIPKLSDEGPGFAVASGTPALRSPGEEGPELGQPAPDGESVPETTAPVTRPPL
ncbi:O-antigen ligase family protein [Verrucomicrobiota bacterium]